MNSVTLSGVLVRDPELRYVGDRGTAKVAFTILNEEGNKKSYIRVEGWTQLAEAIAEQCRKGTEVQVGGVLLTDSWTDKVSEQKRSSTYIKAVNFHILAAVAASRAPASDHHVSPDELGF